MADVADENRDEQPTPGSADNAASAGAGAGTGQKPLAGLMIAYTVGRLGVFVGLAALFWLIGFKGMPGLLAAAIVSIPLSFVLLKTWRVEVARRIEERKVAQLSIKDEFRI